MANSRYPNMSYCMFENTTLAMDQLIDHMVEALDGGPNACKEFLDDMSREELRHYHAMYDLCRDFLAKMEELETAVDQYAEGEDDEVHTGHFTY